MILTVFALSFVSLLATNNVTASTQAEDTLAKIKERGYLIVGADTAYPPFEDINPETNLPEGFDVDMAIIIADGLEVDLTYKTSAWDPIIPNLQAGQFDIIISAMTITEEREVEVDFTRWYYNSSQAWLVKADNPKNILSEDDLNTAGLKIGYQLGTTSDIYANETLTNVATGDKHGYDTVPNAIAALKQGSVDVVLGDWPVLLDAAAADTTLEVAGTFSPELFGFAVRTGDTALLNAVNTILDGLLGTDVNKAVPSDLYNSIHYKWFDSNAPGYTGSVTDAALPSVVLKYDQGSSPGFEFMALLAVLVIPMVRKLKKQN